MDKIIDVINVIMNQNAELSKLTIKILDITMEIKDDFPEAYLLLDENPVSDPSNSKAPNDKDFEEYLDTIRLQLNIMTTF